MSQPDDELPEAQLERSEAGMMPTTTEVLDYLKVTLAHVSGQLPDALTGDTRLDELGVDLKTAGELATAIKAKFSVTLAADRFLKCETVRDLAELIVEGSLLRPAPSAPVIPAQRESPGGGGSPNRPSPSWKRITTHVPDLSFEIGPESLGGDEPPAAGADEAKTDAKYVVWYGTNREPVDANDLSQGFSSKRSQTVHHGSCEVFVPKSHTIGSTGDPWWKVMTGFGDRMRLLSTNGLQDAAFWEQIRAKLGEDASKSAVVFIHGYNVSFESAAIRAAQIGFDLSIRGPMAFFSWPSKGALLGYTDDSAAIEASEAAMTSFLVDFAQKSGADAVHLIVHSMGNRGMLRVAQRVVEKAAAGGKVPFSQIILAAPDVDAGLFADLHVSFKKLAKRTSLYVSSRDLAVGLSRWLHDFPRVGLTPPVSVFDGIDTINVTDVDLSVLGHGYVGDARSVLQDIHQLIATGHAPDQRFGMRSLKDGAGKTYWEFKG